jgi:hypothetical protein
MVGQQPIERGGIGGRDAQGRGEMALHLDQHGGVAAVAQGGKPDAALTRRDHHAMGAGKAIGNIDRRRGDGDRFEVGHGNSPAGGAGAFATEGGTSVVVTRPSGPRSAGRSTGPTMMSVGDGGAGGVVPI